MNTILSTGFDSDHLTHDAMPMWSEVDFNADRSRRATARCSDLTGLLSCFHFTLFLTNLSRDLTASQIDLPCALDEQKGNDGSITL